MMAAAVAHHGRPEPGPMLAHDDAASSNQLGHALLAVAVRLLGAAAAIVCAAIRR